MKINYGKKYSSWWLEGNLFAYSLMQDLLEHVHPTLQITAHNRTLGRLTREPREFNWWDQFGSILASSEQIWPTRMKGERNT